MLEKSLELRVVKALSLQGILCIKFGFEGWPDRLILLGNNRHIWFEFKALKGRLRMQQNIRIERLGKLGDMVYVITEYEQALRAVERAYGTP